MDQFPSVHGPLSSWVLILTYLQEPQNHLLMNETYFLRLALDHKISLVWELDHERAMSMFRGFMVHIFPQKTSQLHPDRAVLSYKPLHHIPGVTISRKYCWPKQAQEVIGTFLCWPLGKQGPPSCIEPSHLSQPPGEDGGERRHVCISVTLPLTSTTPSQLLNTSFSHWSLGICKKFGLSILIKGSFNQNNYHDCSIDQLVCKLFWP